MAHTTSIYYRDRLGFEPEDEYVSGGGGGGVVGGAVSSQQRQSGVSASVAKRAAAKGQRAINNGNGATNGNGNSDYQHEHIMKGGVYEENLNKFKGRTITKCIYFSPFNSIFKGERI